MPMPWSHTDKLPPIIRMRKDLCRLCISKWFDMLRPPSQSRSPLPHPPTDGTGNRAKNYKGIEPPNPEHKAPLVPLHLQNRTAVMAWNWKPEEINTYRRGCCVHFLQSACNSLGGKPNKPSPIAKQCIQQPRRRHFRFQFHAKTAVRFWRCRGTRGALCSGLGGSIPL